MEGFVLKTNGKIKPLGSKKIKASKTKCILLKTFSDIYGIGYLRVTPETYNRARKMKDITMKYTFLDGVFFNSSGQEPYIQNKLYFNDFALIMGKIKELEYCDTVLTNAFWLNDSCFIYKYDDFKVRYTLNGKFYKFKGLCDFFRSVKYSIKEYSDKRLVIDGNHYKFTDKKDVSGDMILSNGDGNLYVETSQDYYDDIKSIGIQSTIYGVEDDVITYEEGLGYNKYKSTEVDNLYVAYCAPKVVASLSNMEGLEVEWRIKNRVRKINGKKCNKSFDKFMHRYFPGTNI